MSSFSEYNTALLIVMVEKAQPLKLYVEHNTGHNYRVVAASHGYTYAYSSHSNIVIRDLKSDGILSTINTVIPCKKHGDECDNVHCVSFVPSVLAFNPNGDRLLCGSKGVIQVFDSVTAKRLVVLNSGISPANKIFFNPEGAYFISRHRDDSATLWHCGSWSQIAHLPAEKNEWLLFNETDKDAADSDSDDVDAVLEWARSVNLRGFLSDETSSPSGQYLATTTFNVYDPLRYGSLRIRDKTDYKRVIFKADECHKEFIYNVLFTDDSKYVISTGADDGTVKIWEIPALDN